jgi:septum formation protein
VASTQVASTAAAPRQRGLPVETTAVDIDETPLEGETAPDMAVRLSRQKAEAVTSSLLPQPSAFIVVASDTIVSLDGEPLGKPRDEAEARVMLQRLRNRTHQVYTAITLIDTRTDRRVTDLAASDVPMRDYADEEIAAYVASGDPFDKAGAYAIQHAGFHPADRFEHCFANVMGLPLCHVTRSLRALGIKPADDVPAACQAHIHYHCPVFDAILNHAT